MGSFQLKAERQREERRENIHRLRRLERMKSVGVENFGVWDDCLEVDFWGGCAYFLNRNWIG